jgi:hypothetical protein
MKNKIIGQVFKQLKKKKKKVIFYKAYLTLKTWLEDNLLPWTNSKSKDSTDTLLVLTKVRLHSVLWPAYNCTELVVATDWDSDMVIKVLQKFMETISI